MMFSGRVKRIHFVGIGGIGMSGIAEILANLGYEISGSDLSESKATGHLYEIGVKIFFEHRAAQVHGSDVVVYSSAVNGENPEILEAKRLGIPVIPRAEMLAELMRLKEGIAVGGSHGKTTTTSMIAAICQAGGLDPTVIIGGRLKLFGSNARLGKGDILIAEADESDRSFLSLSPVLEVITNIDREHLDTFSGLDDIQDTFIKFANRVPFYGGVILCIDDPPLQSIMPTIRRRVITYGTNPQADIRALDIKQTRRGQTVEFVTRDGVKAIYSLPLFGIHNAVNSLGAVATGLELKIPMNVISSSLAAFEGAERRFQIRGEAGGVKVVDDYGHHPTEIRCTLKAARSFNTKGRIIAVFQPHRYSRTYHLMDDFGKAFNDSDTVIITEIYPASESPIEGVNGEILSERIKSFGHRDVRFIADYKNIPNAISGIAREGDLVLLLGAGSITTIGDKVLEELKCRQP